MNNCKHEPDLSLLNEDPDKNTLYSVPCLKCGIGLMIRGKGQDSKIKQISNLSAEPIRIPFTPSHEDFSFYEKHKHLYRIRDVKNEMTADRKMEILYEMLADGDIEVDLFNNLSVKIK